jgi:hypothetical protein
MNHVQHPDLLLLIAQGQNQTRLSSQVRPQHGDVGLFVPNLVRSGGIWNLTFRLAAGKPAEMDGQRVQINDDIRI